MEDRRCAYCGAFLPPLRDVERCRNCGAYVGFPSTPGGVEFGADRWRRYCAIAAGVVAPFVLYDKMIKDRAVR
jgi:predicted amidophosphoribosyltransferase